MSEIEQWLSRYSDYFESLDKEKLEQCDHIFNQQIRFKDPFNDAVGIDSVKRVFRHMFSVCDSSQFEVIDRCGSGYQGYIQWKFHYSVKHSLRSRTIVGISQIRFNPQGEVIEHIDYWDSAEYIYEKLPLLGGLLSWIRKRYLQAV